MVLITTSTTTPVNPPNTTTPISQTDLWNALLAKARHPEAFVPVIEGSRVIREDAERGELVRGVRFQGGMGEVEEVVRFVGGMKMDFYIPSTGQAVSNIISTMSPSSPSPTETNENESSELYLTFTFEWPHPELEEGSGQAKELAASRTAMGRGVVPHTVEVAREMKASGQLG